MATTSAGLGRPASRTHWFGIKHSLTSTSMPILLVGWIILLSAQERSFGKTRVFLIYCFNIRTNFCLNKMFGSKKLIHFRASGSSWRNLSPLAQKKKKMKKMKKKKKKKKKKTSNLPWVLFVFCCYFSVEMFANLEIISRLKLFIAMNKNIAQSSKITPS